MHDDTMMRLLRMLAAERGYRLVRQESADQRRSRDVRARLHKEERQLDALHPDLQVYHLNDGWTVLDEDGAVAVAEGLTYDQARDFLISRRALAHASPRSLRLVGKAGR